VYRLAVSSSWVLRELTLEAVSLEDVFVRLTRHDEAAAPAAVAATEPDAAPDPDSERPA